MGYRKSNDSSRQSHRSQMDSIEKIGWGAGEVGENRMNIEQLPHQSLGFFPTPLVELTRLASLLGGPRIWIKRDDQTGLAFGGNKTRKLEFLLGDAIAKGADTIITAGAAQSNHCRQTAAAAAHVGLKCHLVLGGTEPDLATGNLLLDQILGSQIHWAGKHRKGEDIPILVKELKSAGKQPYVIPYGGSNELGALAFVEALKEVELQSHQQRLSFSHIIFPSSSGGTQAGLMLGQKRLGTSYQLLGIQIDKGEMDQVSLAQSIIDLANQTAGMIGDPVTFSEQDLILNPNYMGDGYGVVSSREQEAISLTAQTEGILLDPVYTGRAMGGLMDLIRIGAIDAASRVLFWHTGGTPALFAYGTSSFLSN